MQTTNTAFLATFRCCKANANNCWRVSFQFLLAALAVFTFSPNLQAQTELVKDANSVGQLWNSRPQYIMPFQGKLYYIAESPQLGREAHEYDPATGNVKLLHDIEVGPSNGAATQAMAYANGKVYWLGESDEYGKEWWEYDPASGNVRVIDLLAGPGDGEPSHMVEYNGEAYFNYSFGPLGGELWRIDAVTDEPVFVKDIEPGSEDSDPLYLATFNGSLFMSANVDTIGREVFRYHVGTDSVYQVSNLAAGTGSSDPRNFVASGGQLYFVATDSVVGRELFYYDPVADSVFLTQDVNPSTNWAEMESPTALNGDVYWAANDGTNGKEIWHYDAVADTARLLDDLNNGSAGSDPQWLAVANNKLFWRADTGGARLMFCYDPVADTLGLPYNIGQAAQGQPNTFFQYLTELNGVLYMEENQTGLGNELFAYDPAADSSWTAANPYTKTEDFQPEDLVLVNNVIYMHGNDGIHNRELWAYDIAQDTLFMLGDLDTTSNGVDGHMVYCNGSLLFRGHHPNWGYELFRYDIAADTIVLAADIEAGSSSGSPVDLVAIGDTVYFNATQTGTGSELWMYDAVNDTAMLAYDINPGTDGSSPKGFARLNGILYFRAHDGVHGAELYSYDPSTGTAALVYDIRPGSSGAAPTYFTPFNGQLFFEGRAPGYGYELHRYDPATGVGEQLIDLNVGSNHSLPSHFVELNNKLYFTGDHDVYGEELWVYDPVVDSVSLTTDYRPGDDNSDPRYTIAYDGQLLTSLRDATIDRQLALYNPEVNSYTMLDDYWPGSGSSDPKEFVLVGNTLYMSGTDGIHGTELLKHELCMRADRPTLTATDSSLCVGESLTLAIDTGSALNDATTWVLYANDISATPLDSSTTGSFTLSPASNTTYYVAGAGGCVAVPKYSESLQVTVNALPTVVLNSFNTDTLETAAGLVALPAASPAGGSYTGLGVAGAMYDASLVTGASDTIVYTYTDSVGCVAAQSTVVQLCHSADMAALTASADSICDGTAITLSVATSAALNDATTWSLYSGACGGTLEASNASGTFSVSPGSSTSYYVVGEGGCTSIPVCSGGLSVTVAATPAVALNQFNMDTLVAPGGSLPLPNATPAGGTYLGLGISGNMLNVASLSGGTYELVYQYTNAAGCSNTDTVTAFVCNAPDVPALTASASAICIGESATIDVGASNLNDATTWSLYSGSCQGTLVASNSTGSFSVSPIQTTDYYVIGEGACISNATCSPVLSIASSAATSIAISPLTSVCESDAPVTLSATPAGGTFSGAGVSGNSFDPSAVAPGSQPFSYTYTNNDGCTSTETGFVEVRENPTVTLGAFADSVCSSLTAVACPVATPAGGIYTGNGITGVLLEPQVAGLGQHTISYTFTDVHGCSGTASTDVLVVDCGEPLSAESLPNEQADWTVYPNPNNGTFQIAHSYQGSLAVRVFSTTGALVYELPASTGNREVVLPDVAPGMYLLQLLGAEVNELQRITVY